MAKPRLYTKCVANYYAATDERIAEFGSDHGGGLISIRHDSTGRTVVTLYRLDPRVKVIVLRDEPEFQDSRPGGASKEG